MSFEWLFPIGVEGSLVVIVHLSIILASIFITAVGAHRIATETKLGGTLLFAPMFIVAMSVVTIIATVNAAATIGLIAQLIIIALSGGLLVMFWRAVRHPERH